jgi:hypothetical protein
MACEAHGEGIDDGMCASRAEPHVTRAARSRHDGRRGGARGCVVGLDGA